VSTASARLNAGTVHYSQMSHVDTCEGEPWQGFNPVEECIRCLWMSGNKQFMEKWCGRI